MNRARLCVRRRPGVEDVVAGLFVVVARPRSDILVFAEFEEFLDVFHRAHAARLGRCERER